MFKGIGSYFKVKTSRYATLGKSAMIQGWGFSVAECSRESVHTWRGN